MLGMLEKQEESLMSNELEGNNVININVNCHINNTVVNCEVDDENGKKVEHLTQKKVICFDVV
jgi:hypothetical protein